MYTLLIPHWICLCLRTISLLKHFKSLVFFALTLIIKLFNYQSSPLCLYSKYFTSFDTFTLPVKHLVCLTVECRSLEQHSTLKQLLYIIYLEVSILNPCVLSCAFRANLSDSYFTNRQDRYVLIADCAELADYFEQLVTVVSSMSFQLQADDSMHLSPELQHCHPFDGTRPHSICSFVQ